MLRAPQKTDLEEIRSRLLDTLPLLEAEAGWYASIFLERKASRSLWANLKQTQLAEQIGLGAVLRVYDGSTLYEQATDALDAASLKIAAQGIVARARASGSTKTSPRPYRPATWAERVARPLDPEILSQIPKNAGPRTPVHFGVRFNEDPFTETPASTFARLRGTVDRCKALAPQAGLTADELSYVLARQTLSEECSIFIDRESNLSQTLFRVALP